MRFPEAANRNYSHEELLRRHTGWSTEPEPWAKRREAWAVLQAQTDELADRLEACGIQARLPATITAVSAVTLQEDVLDNYRPIRFLPAIAARERRPYLNALRYWLETNEAARRYVRFGVVTYGEPLSLGDDLREAITVLTRRISRWASYIRKKYGIEVIYRGVEYTFKERTEGEGRTLHLHANVLYWPHRVLRADEWRAFLTSTHERLAAHWKDNGKVEDVAEIVKYVVKPEDLKDTTDDELVWLYEGTFKKRISAPMNSFKAFVSDLRKDRQKVVNVSSRGLKIVSKARKLDRATPKEARVAGGRATNVILGVTLPQWRHTPWAESMILVQNRERHAIGEAAETFRNDIEALHMEALIYWRENGAPEPSIAMEVAEQWGGGADNVVPFGQPRRPKDYIVHTSRVIVHHPENGEADEVEIGSETGIETGIRPIPIVRSGTRNGLSFGNGPPERLRSYPNPERGVG